MTNHYMDVFSQWIGTVRKAILFCYVLFLAYPVKGQETPVTPVSYRVFDQSVFNPAITGSKDYATIRAIASFQGKNKSQILSLNGRLAKSSPAYLLSRPVKEFTNIGVGGYLFNDVNAVSTSAGMGASFAYHLPLNSRRTSFLSVGASVSGVYNKVPASSTETSGPWKETYFPNAGLGIYYYGPAAFAGISASNLLGNPDTASFSNVPVSREYFMMAGYKIILSSKRNIVIEPSVILNTDDSLSFGFRSFVKPMIRLYVDRVCIGTFLNNYDNFSFFFQYNYPGLSLGSYFEYPINAPYYKKELIAEITLGINLSGRKSRNRENVHW